jgi:hypothetical protein
LSNFPETIEAANDFEASCCRINSVFYTTKSEGEVEIKGKMSSYNLESAFQKDFRLKTIKEWNYDVFQEKLGNKISFGLLTGPKLAGKTELAKFMEKNMGYTIIDYNEMNNTARKLINEEYEKMDPPNDPIPDEENPPFEKVEEEVAKLVKQLAAKNGKILFDGYATFFVDTEQAPVAPPDPEPEGWVAPVVEVPFEQQGW